MEENSRGVLARQGRSLFPEKKTDKNMNLNNTELRIFLADAAAQLWSHKDQDPNPSSTTG